MGAKRKRHTEEFKAKVALEAVKGVRTLSELSAMQGCTQRSSRSGSGSCWKERRSCSVGVKEVWARASRS